MDTIREVFENLTLQASENRRYTRTEWVKRRQPRRARFLAKVLWYDKGTPGPFYGYDYEKRRNGQGLRKGWKDKNGIMQRYIENEHVGLIKLKDWLEGETENWYCASIFACIDDSKLTGKYKDERAEYSHWIFKQVKSNDRAKQCIWLNQSLKFDKHGMVELKKLQAIPPPVAKHLRTA